MQEKYPLGMFFPFSTTQNTNTKHKTQNTKHKTQNTKHKTQNTKHKTQNTKNKKQKTKQNKTKQKTKQNKKNKIIRFAQVLGASLLMDGAVFMGDKTSIGCVNNFCAKDLFCSADLRRRKSEISLFSKNRIKTKTKIKKK